MTSQGLPALLSGHGRVDLPHAQVVLESLACTGPHVGRSGLELRLRPIRGGRRAREIFHECRDGLVRAALRQHGRLIDRIALQRTGQRASQGDTLWDFGEVEEAQLDLTLGDQFAADCERGVARLSLDLVEDSELGKRGARDGARGVGDRGIGVCERTRSEHYAMLQRNLLYTGVTRGKRLVVLVGQKKAVAIAVRNASGRRRWSKLKEWLSSTRSVRL